MKMRLLPVLLFLITSVAECLMLRKIIVPQYRRFGEDAVLKCEFELGRDRLYAVKWYKDNEEFFRYIPRYNPPTQTHPVDGVRVEESMSNDKRVQLRSLTVGSTGVYRCEVSAEAPSFPSIMGEGRMTVVYLPKEAPQITGNLGEEYEIGDVLDLNCTSAKSFPPATLSWYINDSPVDVPWSITLHPALLDPTPPTLSPYRHSYGQQNSKHFGNIPTSTPSSTSPFNYLMISTLRLQLQLQQHHFGPTGAAKVRCVARMSSLFWQDGDEKVFGYHGHGIQEKQADDVEMPEETNAQYEVDEENEDSGNEHEDDVEHHRRHSFREGQHHRRRHNNNVRSNHHHTMVHLDEDSEEEYYRHLSAFRQEALVLVRGGCSKPKISPVLDYSCLLLVFISFLRGYHPQGILL